MLEVFVLFDIILKADRSEYMSYETRRYNIPKLTPKMLGIYHCGITINHPGHATRSLLPTYAAHFIISGKGRYIVQGREYTLHAGQGFMLQPFVACNYIGDENEPWTYIYANFSGAGDAALAASIGIDENNYTFEFAGCPDIEKNIRLMFEESEKQSPNSLAITSYFLLAMSRLAELKLSGKKMQVSDDEYVNKAFEFVKNNYPYKITVGDIAKSIGIDRSYLHRVFKRSTGISPEQYIMSFRLEKAKEIMQNVDGASLTDIAIGTGFYDISHFSRVFTKKYGISPSGYIKENKK